MKGLNPFSAFLATLLVVLPAAYATAAAARWGSQDENLATAAGYGTFALGAFFVLLVTDVSDLK